jgi:hypothetical protein
MRTIQTSAKASLAAATDSVKPDLTKKEPSYKTFEIYRWVSQFEYK